MSRLILSLSDIKDPLQATSYELQPGIYKVGRSSDSIVRLRSGLISAHHLDLEVTGDNQVLVTRRATNDVFYTAGGENGESLIERGKTVILSDGDTLRCDPFRINLLFEDDSEIDTVIDYRRVWFRTADEMHEALMGTMRDDVAGGDEGQAASRAILDKINEVASRSVEHMDNDLMQFRFEEIQTLWLLSLSHYGKEVRINDELLSPAEKGTLGLVINMLRNKIGSIESEEIADEEVSDVIFQIKHDIEPYKELVVNYDCRKTLWDRVNGLGSLQDLIDDPLISEIMVNSNSQIFVERRGRIRPAMTSIASEEETMRILERIVAPVGRHVDYSSPLVDARLDTMRVNAVLGNVALGGTCITIRKFSGRPLSTDDLVERGTMSNQLANFLRACIQAKKNLIISGGTGTGKTTLLNILANFIPPEERIITIEDSAELQLGHSNLVRMEARPRSVEGHGEITIRDLVRNALRMRPDRIIVGECRGAEAFDMIQAMNTGHPGSMSTAHANSPRNMFIRLESMFVEAVNWDESTVRNQIASTMDLVVQLERRASGIRVVSVVSEVVGIHPVSGEIETKDIFVVKDEPLGEPKWVTTGFVPSFFEELLHKGLIKLDEFCT